MEGVVWQAEHLVERSNSATFSDTRLVVLVCRNCHRWKHFKDSNKEQYDRWVKDGMTGERIDHWDRCRAESWRASKMDWKMVKIGLEQELAKIKANQ
jgi:hypothetical protein